MRTKFKQFWKHSFWNKIFVWLFLILLVWLQRIYVVEVLNFKPFICVNIDSVNLCQTRQLRWHGLQQDLSLYLDVNDNRHYDSNHPYLVDFNILTSVFNQNSFNWRLQDRKRNEYRLKLVQLMRLPRINRNNNRFLESPN